MKSMTIGLLLLALFAAGKANAQVSCSRSITSCGCTITEPGLYIVNADLSASQGLTALNGCIDIERDRVQLVLNGHNISGGAGSVGIHMLPGSHYGFIEGGKFFGGPTQPQVFVQGWEFGIESEADNVTIDLPNAFGNATGVLLKGVYNNRVIGRGSNGFGTSANGNYGIWIVGGNSNQIAASLSENNGIAGIYVGCSATGPTGTPCPAAQASRGNLIYNYSMFSNGPTGTQPYGIVLEAGSTRNTITNTLIGEDTKFDLFDGNGHCANNLWHLNGFATANQTCIH